MNAVPGSCRSLLLAVAILGAPARMPVAAAPFAACLGEVVEIEGATLPTSTSATSEPLLQQSNLTYLGAFALPPGVFGASSFDYGGKALTPYHDLSTGKYTLFMEGHAQRPGNIAQVEIPTSFVNSSNWGSLPVASILQPFSDVTDGRLGEVDPTNQFNPTFVYGLLPYNGRLIVGASNVYSASQQVSHGVSGLDLSRPNDFRGWYAMNSIAPVRALGTMMVIPPEWQTLLGGPAATGEYGLSIVSTTSAGPAFTAFNPDNVGSTNPIPGTTSLYYPINHPVCGSVNCEAAQGNIYNLTSEYGGFAFPSGSRSVLFVQSHGTGPYCYGTAAECNDPYQPDVKGPHAPPYRYQILAYDANDLLAVRSGTKQTWEPQPYAVWVLSDQPTNMARISGSGYDQETHRLFITRDYGSQARVEVYQITVPNNAPPPATRFYPVTPCRVADTRNAAGGSGGPALTANADRTFPVGGLCGIPVDAASVAVNATVTQPTAGGFVRMWSASDFAPDTTALSFAAGKTRANNGIVRLGGGSVSARYELAGGGAGTTHFILDVVGYFR